jgi:hypothetical protein
VLDPALEQYEFSPNASFAKSKINLCFSHSKVRENGADGTEHKKELELFVLSTSESHHSRNMSSIAEHPPPRLTFFNRFGVHGQELTII